MDESELTTAHVLVVGESQEIAGAIAHALDASGCAVVRLPDRSMTLATARRQEPNAIVIEGHAADAAVLDICRVLRDDPVCNVTPVIVATPARPRRDDVLAALAAGA